MKFLVAIKVCACLTALGAGIFGTRWYLAYRTKKRLRLSTLELLDIAQSEQNSLSLDQRVIRYAIRLTQLISVRATQIFSMRVRTKSYRDSKAKERFDQRICQAGLKDRISIEAYLETQTRLLYAGVLLGALCGSFLSLEASVVGAILGGIVGFRLITHALDGLIKERSAQAQLYLPEMLEVASLGLRSGVTFDRSFELYGQHFSSEFARACEQTYQTWSLGFASREDALRALAKSYDCEALTHVVDSIVRSLRFGTTLADSLEETARESRAAYRANLEEKVAKAPIKMMVPTGALILPAMLLLVLGPVLLELAGGFSI